MGTWGPFSEGKTTAARTEVSHLSLVIIKIGWNLPPLHVVSMTT